MTTNQIRWVPIVAALLTLAGGVGAAAADTPTGLRADILGQIQEAETKLIELAEATPASKYSWRPAKGVRSIAEVYLHVAAGNYMLPRFAGVEPPGDVDAMNLEKSAPVKDRVVAVLKQSFEHARQAVARTPDADLEREIEMFGGKTTVRGSLLVLATHEHEHLGQSIAYARMNGVVPPWTAREQRAQAQKAKEKDKEASKD
jgi:uncharacterized damage-inducible protein DinB